MENEEYNKKLYDIIFSFQYVRKVVVDINNQYYGYDLYDAIKKMECIVPYYNYDFFINLLRSGIYDEYIDDLFKIFLIHFLENYKLHNIDYRELLHKVRVFRMSNSVKVISYTPKEVENCYEKYVISSFKREFENNVNYKILNYLLRLGADICKCDSKLDHNFNLSAYNIFDLFLNKITNVNFVSNNLISDGYIDNITLTNNYQELLNNYIIPILRSYNLELINHIL